jgi:hypothetical protein
MVTYQNVQAKESSKRVIYRVLQILCRQGEESFKPYLRSIKKLKLKKSLKPIRIGPDPLTIHQKHTWNKSKFSSNFLFSFPSVKRRRCRR